MHKHNQERLMLWNVIDHEEKNNSTYAWHGGLTVHVNPLKYQVNGLNRIDSFKNVTLPKQ